MTRSKNARRRPPIAPREWAVAFFGAVTLAFTAWGLGGVVTWSLHAMLVGAGLTLFCAIFPLPLRWNGIHGEHGNWKNLKCLLMTPVFWLCAAFLVYITIQAFNPAFEVVRDERGWWVEAIEPPLGVWLPTSVRSDYESMDAFRVINMFLASFALMCGLWIGLQRRTTLLIVLWVFILSGVGMAFVAMLQHFTDTKEVFWSIRSVNRNFWGSFFYRNQGVAYLNLVLVASTFLYFYYAKRAQEYVQSGGPHFLLLLFFGLIVSSVGLALSRGGILFAGLISLGFLICVLLYYTSSTLSFGASVGIASVAALLLSAGAYLAHQSIDWKAIETRFGDIGATIENADQDPRALSTRATLDMVKDRSLLGWGAGSFRYIFPMYQQNYPEIFYKRYHKKKGWVGRRVYRYAHNDIVQFLAEYGVIGCCCLLGVLGAFFWVLLRSSMANFCGAMMLGVGMMSALAHAFFDFIFNSPAYWVASLAFFAIAAKLLKAEAQRRC